MPAATTFDSANARFIPDGNGDLKLNRDWRRHKATRREVEVLFAYSKLVSDLLETFIALWGAGTSIAPEGLSEDEQRALSRYLDLVGRVMTPAQDEQQEVPDGGPL